MAAKSTLLKTFVSLTAKGGDVHFPSACFLLCFLLATPAVPQAAEWYLEPSLRGRAGYDNNAFMSITDPQSALTSTISPEFLFGVRTPSLHTRGLARVDVIRSTEEAIDQTNVFSRLLSTYQGTRNRWNIDANVLRYTTLVAPIVPPDAIPGVTPTPAQVFNPVLGLVTSTAGLTKIGTTRIGFAPTFFRVMTRRASLQLGYRFTDLLFDDTTETLLVNSQTHQVTGGVGYRLTPIDTINASVTYSRFDSDVIQTDWVTLLGDIRHSFSPTFEGDLRAGATYNFFDDSIFPTFFLTLKKQLRTGDFTAILQRNIYGGAFGNPIGVEQINVLWDTEIVPNRWFFFLAGQVSRFENIGTGGNPANNRTYFQIQPRLAWQLTRQLFLDISYRYRRNDSDVFGDADSNAILLGLVYNFERRSISR